jgi:hypothetical protein
MRFGDSPRAKQPLVSDKPDVEDEAERKTDGENENSKGKGKGKGGFQVGQSELADEGERKIASGAMTRVRRKRQKEKHWARRRGSRGSDSEPDEVCFTGFLRCTWLTSQRQLGPAKSEHHYNLHMPTQALQHSEIPSLLLGYA